MCIFIYIHIYTHKSICTHTHPYSYTHTCVYIYLHIYIYIFIHVCTFIYIPITVYTHTHTHTHTHKYNIYTLTHVRTHNPPTQVEWRTTSVKTNSKGSTKKRTRTAGMGHLGSALHAALQAGPGMHWTLAPLQLHCVSQHRRYTTREGASRQGAEADGTNGGGARRLVEKGGARRLAHWGTPSKEATHCQLSLMQAMYKGLKPHASHLQRPWTYRHATHLQRPWQTQHRPCLQGVQAHLNDTLANFFEGLFIARQDKQLNNTLTSKQLGYKLLRQTHDALSTIQ